MLEHAWAEIEHDLGYKAREEIPLTVRRRLSRLAGLLGLRRSGVPARSAATSTATRARCALGSPRARRVPLDRLSLVALVDCAEVKALDETIAASLGRPLGDDAFFPDYLLKMLVLSGVRSAEDARSGVREHAKSDHDDGRSILRVDRAALGRSPRSACRSSRAATRSSFSRT